MVEHKNSDEQRKRKEKSIQEIQNGSNQVLSECKQNLKGVQ